MKIRSVLAMAVAAASLLSGCSSQGGEVTAESPTGNNRPSAASDPTKAPTQEPTKEAPAVNPKFGETFKYANGVSVTITAPVLFKPSEYATSGKAPAYVAFDVTIVNGGTTNYDPTLAFFTAQSGNVEAAEVYDSAQGFQGSPNTPLLPGRETKFKIGYGVADPADIVMEARVGFDFDSVIFTT